MGGMREGKGDRGGRGRERGCGMRPRYSIPPMDVVVAAYLPLGLC